MYNMVGTPIRLDGAGGVMVPGFPIHGDPATAGSQIVPQFVAAPHPPPGPPGPVPLTTGLVPPVPLNLNIGDLQAQGSSNQGQIIPANIVGPSTFVSEAPRSPPAYAPPPPAYAPPPSPPQQYQQPQQQHQQPPPQQQQHQYQQQSPSQHHNTQYTPQQPIQQATLKHQQQDQKTMDGWVPLDNDGSKLAKAVGVKITTDEDVARQRQVQEQRYAKEQKLQEQRQVLESPSQPDYKDTGYSIKVQDEEQQVDNELEILQTNAVRLGATPKDHVLVFEKRQPVYPGKNQDSSTKVVIHAQNVIIRNGPDGELESITHSNDSINPVSTFPAYQQVPQLNHYLREQLRLAAMNQLIQSAVSQPVMQPIMHALQDKPFPRPLSLREIAAAVRNGEFPQPTRDQLLDPMAAQPTVLSPTHMELNLPLLVRMRQNQVAQQQVQDPVSLGSIATQDKVPLGSLYTVLQQQLFDPTEPVDYSLLAALHQQKHQHKPAATTDYGDSVKYSASTRNKGKEVVQVVDAEPVTLVKQTGNLRHISENALKQLLLQELHEVENESQQQVLLPVGISNVHRPVRNKHLYGTNSHPFAFLGEEPETHVTAHEPQVLKPLYEETIEYTLPHGEKIEDYVYGDAGGDTKDHSTFGLDEHDVDAKALDSETLVRLGKGVLNSALVFSRHHNPLTLWNRLRKLPPVKVDLYKVPVGIPEGIMDKLPERFKVPSGYGGGSYGGGSYGGWRGGRKRKLRSRKQGKH